MRSLLKIGLNFWVLLVLAEVAILPVSAADPLVVPIDQSLVSPEYRATTEIPKVTNPAKQVKDPNLLEELQKQGIDKDYVELSQDYALAYDSTGRKLEEKSPYAQFYTDLKSDKKFMVVQGLPMVNANGETANTTWTTKDNKNFSAGINNFIASVATNKVTVIAINDQPDGKTKKDMALSFTPQLFLNNIEIKPTSTTPTLLSIDPLNENYTNNTLEWDYGICLRRLRIIEGSILGSWVFANKPIGEVRIKYNQTGDYRLRLGQFKVGDGEEIVKPGDFDQLAQLPQGGYPVTISDSATFYPNADPESTSVDGSVYRSVADQTWAGIRDGAGTHAKPSDTNARVDVSSGLNDNQWNEIDRGFFLFDTSGLSDSASISAAVLSLYGRYRTDTGSFAPDINIYTSSPASNTDLVTGDYNLVGSTAQCDTAITYAGWVDGAYNDFTFNATGRGNITVTGVSKFSARTAKYDVANTPPTWVSQKYAEIIFWLSEQGTGYKPKLVVTYTSAATPTVTTQVPTNITATTAIGSGNITDTGSANATIRGVQWGTVTGIYSTNVTEDGNFGTGTFTANLTGLPVFTIIYCRAEAYNSAGWGYGSEASFETSELSLYLVLYIDGVAANSTPLNGATWNNSTYNWITCSANTTPWLSYITESVSGVEVLRYQPNSMIIGTVLPNRASGGDYGVITWGANPTGVTTLLSGSLTPSIVSIPAAGAETDIQDIAPVINVNPTGGVAVPTNPLSPFINVLAFVWTLPAITMWTIVGMIATILTFGLIYWKVPHLTIAGIAACIVIGFFSVIHAFPPALLYLAIIGIVGLAINEWKG